MPELPEVEAQRKMLEATIVGMRVTVVNPLEQGGGGRHGLFDDKIICEEMTAEALTAKIGSNYVLAARRRGKQLWLELGPSLGGAPASSLLIHLGMTGALVVRGGEAPKYKRLDVDMSVWPPRFTKLELNLEGPKGSAAALAYTDSRRFGRILLRDGDATSSLPVSALAADPILCPPTAEEFARLLGTSTMPVKAALLNQTRIVCGVGNWVADEVFYQSRILPSAPCNALSAEQARALHAAVIDVCKVACKADGDSGSFPKSWLFHHRWANQTTGSISSPLGRIHFDTVGGRTTAYLPHLQKAGAALVVPKAARARPKAKAKRSAEGSEAEEEEEPPKKRVRKASAGGAADETVALVDPPLADALAAEAKPASKSRAKPKPAAKRGSAAPDAAEAAAGALAAEAKPKAASRTKPKPAAKRGSAAPDAAEAAAGALAAETKPKAASRAKPKPAAKRGSAAPDTAEDMAGAPAAKAKPMRKSRSAKA